MLNIIIISIVYALIRAKHDSYLVTGRWKKWAFIEGIFIALAVSYLNHSDWYHIGMGAVLFGMSFWIIFDMATGLLFGKNPLYLGTTGFDSTIRKATCYTEKYKGLNYLIFKSVWLLLIIKLYML